MKLFSFLAIASAGLSGATQMVNRTLTNGWGSTPAQRHYIDQAQALTAINAGIQHATAIKYVLEKAAVLAKHISVPMNIAVLDPSSSLIGFIHMDNAYLGSIDISMKKAKTVTLFNGLFPSYGLLNRSQPGGDLFGIEETNGGLVVFGGGQPIYDHDGYFIGAVGVSGGAVSQDIEVSICAAQSIGTTITLFP